METSGTGPLTPPRETRRRRALRMSLRLHAADDGGDLCTPRGAYDPTHEVARRPRITPRRLRRSRRLTSSASGNASSSDDVVSSSSSSLSSSSQECSSSSVSSGEALLLALAEAAEDETRELNDHEKESNLEGAGTSSIADSLKTGLTHIDKDHSQNNENRSHASNEDADCNQGLSLQKQESNVGRVLFAEMHEEAPLPPALRSTRAPEADARKRAREDQIAQKAETRAPTAGTRARATSNTTVRQNKRRKLGAQQPSLTLSLADKEDSDWLPHESDRDLLERLETQLARAAPRERRPKQRQSKRRRTGQLSFVWRRPSSLTI